MSDLSLSRLAEGRAGKSRPGREKAFAKEDGLNTQTRFDCELLYTLEKKDLTQTRGEVGPETGRL
jgi:hypothetical protein